MSEARMPKSYWAETLSARAPTPLPGSRTADVAIIGGGFTGLATALELRKARPDLRVIVLEAHRVGYGASGRNAGFAMTLFGLTLEVTALRFGRKRAAEAFRHMQECVRHACALLEEERISCDLEKTGLLVVANNKAQLRRIEHELRLAESLGIRELQRWDRRRLMEAVASGLYQGAKFDPDCALLNPWKLAHGLREAAERRGAEIFEGCPVQSMRQTAGGVLLQTPVGSVEAGKVIVATNAYTSWLPRLNWKAAPVFTYIVTTEPLTDAQMRSIGWQGRQGIEDARNLVHYYRLTADNRLLMGGGSVGYHWKGQAENPRFFEDAATRAELESFVLRLFPQLQGVRFSHHWGGPVSVPLDMAPAIGSLGPNVYYSLGCVGHGVALSLKNGQILRDLALDLDTELTHSFFVDRFVPPFPPEPLRVGMAHAIRGALALQDRWDERG